MIEGLAKVLTAGGVDFNSFGTVFDIGSRDGVQALELANLFLDANIVAIECNRDTLEKCRRNIARNPRITLVEKAVNSYTGRCAFYPIDPTRTITSWPDGNPGASSLFIATGDYPVEQFVQNEVEVECIRLDDLCESLRIETIDLIWMDLQGAELLALESAGPLLDKVRYIYTEVSHRPIYSGQCLFDDVETFLTARGFRRCTQIDRTRWQQDVIYENSRFHSEPAESVRSGSYSTLKIAASRHVKDALLWLAVTTLPLYFRYFPIRRGKSAIWKRIVLRYLVWRRLRLTARSVFGARFAVRLTDVLQAYLYFFGVWEPVITRYLFDSLSDGDIFIDVGANIGYYTLLASRRVGANGKVYAIEAASTAYSELQNNLLLNHIENVTAFHVAVSDTEGRVPVWLSQEGELAGATTLSHVADRRKAMKIVETVDAKPLQHIVDIETIRKARFIKIDVEGAEWAVVKSLGDMLKTVSSQTEFIIEVNAALVRRSGGTIEEFLGYFAAAGFEPFVITNRYDVRFMASKVRSVELRRLDGWKSRQIDLVFRRAANSIYPVR